MAFQSENTLITNKEIFAELGRVVLSPFRAFGTLMIKMAENNPRVHALNTIAAMTDEELAEMGLNREQAVRNAVPHCM